MGTGEIIYEIYKFHQLQVKITVKVYLLMVTVQK